MFRKYLLHFAYCWSTCRGPIYKKQQNFAKYQLLNFLQELLPEAALHCSSIVLQNLVQNPFQKDDANINTLLEGA